MRGLGSGLIWGGMAGLAGLAVLSELVPLRQLHGAARIETVAVAPDNAPPAPLAGPTRPPITPRGLARPEVGEVAAPPGSEFARPLPDTDPFLPAEASALAKGAAPILATPGTGSAEPLSDRLPASAPVLDAGGPAASPMPGAVEPQARPPMVPAPGVETGRSSQVLPPAPGPSIAADPPPAPVADPPPAPAPGTLPEEFGPTLPVADPAPPPATAADLVVTNRLPRIGDAPRAEVGEAATIEARDRRPIERFARPFDNPEGKPRLAILLIDAGDPGLDRAALARLPFPVTFALDPTGPDAAALATIYRSAGQEVVMLATGIPEGAQASDLEVTFAALASMIPEAVAVLDLPVDGLQTNRPLATLVVPILKAQGRGLISWDQGLNAADQVARREGLPSAVLFRSIDGADADAAAIRRALDRAVFRAGQTGQVAVAGRALPETVAALLEWTVEGRAASVALAPVTALMTLR